MSDNKRQKEDSPVIRDPWYVTKIMELEAELAAVKLKRDSWRRNFETQVSDLEARNKALTEALEFYAKSSCADCALEHGRSFPLNENEFDDGEIAREALSGGGKT